LTSNPSSTRRRWKLWLAAGLHNNDKDNVVVVAAVVVAVVAVPTSGANHPTKDEMEESFVADKENALLRIVLVKQT
jgi:serine protease inhibitor